MKITLVGPVYPYRGGIAHHTDLLTRALRERHDVQVVSFRRQYPRWLYPGRSDREPSDEEQAVEAEFWLDPLQPWTWWQTSRRIEQFNPELVVIQWWTTFWAPAFATMAYLLRRAGLSPAFIVHNVLPHEPRPGDGLLARLALRQATKFIVHAAREGKRLRALFPHAKLEVCPLPCFGQFADQRTSRAKARQRIGLPQDGPVVLLFGLIRPYKGLRYLIEAVSLLHREACSIRLVVAGEFWDDIAHYRQQVQQLQLEPWVLLEDRYIPNEEVALYFSAADVFAAPYVGGSQSGAVSLALGFGLPVVATDAIWDGETLSTEYDRITVVPSADAQALAAGISQALQCRERQLPQQPEAADEGWRQLAEAVERLRG